MNISRSIIIGLNKKGESLQTGHPMSDDYHKCDFSESKAGSCTLLSGIYRDCKFIAANLDRAVICGRFVKCDFTNALFNGTIFRNGTVFEDCLFAYADFTGNQHLWLPRFDAFCKLEKIVGAKSEWDSTLKCHTLVVGKSTSPVMIRRALPPAQDYLTNSRDHRGSFAPTDYSWRDRLPINTDDLYDQYESGYPVGISIYKTPDKSATLLSSNEDELKIE